VVPAEHIYGTRFRYDSQSGEIPSIERVFAGYGKVAGARMVANLIVAGVAVWSSLRPLTAGKLPPASGA
jgi:hypothetical protein